MSVGFFNKMTEESGVRFWSIACWSANVCDQPETSGTREMVGQRWCLPLNMPKCSNALSSILLRAVPRLFGKELCNVVVVHRIRGSVTKTDNAHPSGPSGL